MEFKIFFLKENTRIYSQSDLITFLQSNPNITLEKENSYGRREFVYHHHILNFEAKFIMSEKSVVPNLERLDPRFFDINFYVEFDVLLSNYAVEILLDIIEEITKRFRFLVHNQAIIEGVVAFRRAQMIKIFDAWKKAYAAKHPEAVANYKCLDPQAFSQVYGYLQKRKRLELTISDPKIIVTNYYFLHSQQSRSAYVAIRWDGNKQFILPPAVDILILDDGKISKWVPMQAVLEKTEKMFRTIDGYGDIRLLDAKQIKKFHKIIVKERFAPLNAQLSALSLDKILDI